MTKTTSTTNENKQKTVVIPEGAETYTKQQLIDALQKEYEWLCHDDFDPEEDLSLEEHLEMLQELSYDELVEETSTDDIFTLEEFMRTYG